MTWVGVARLLAFAVAVFGGLLLIGAGWTPDVQPDADAYWHAALRLREGLPLYLPAGPDETEVYRYAPWFAYAWLPLTFLPQAAAFVVWRGLLLLAAAAAVIPLLRRPGPASITLAVLVFCLLISNLPAANVTTLMIGVLAIGLPTRAGPILLGVAGSLKVFPLLLVVGYLAERRWRDAAVALSVAAVLWLHVLAFGASTYPTSTIAGSSFYLGGVSLYALSPVGWGIAGVVMVGGLVWLVWSRSRWTWLLAAACIPILVPRVWLPDAAYVAVAAALLMRSVRSFQSIDGRKGC